MSPMTALDFETLRKEMVDRQIAARDVRDERVLEALRTVPREAFVPERLAEFAYDDAPLPIGEEQTISQPFVVALMAEALEIRPGDKVLEIGAGSGYAAAVLSRLAREVWTVERHPSLAREARERMAAARVPERLRPPRRRHSRLAGARALRRHRGGGRRPRGPSGPARSARPRRPAGDPDRTGPAHPEPGAGAPPSGRHRRPRGSRGRALRAADRRPGVAGGGGDWLMRRRPSPLAGPRASR